MAISGGDGSIILTTKVDESGITKSTTSIKEQFTKVGSYLKTIGTSIQTTFTKVGAGIKNTFLRFGSWLKGFATSIAVHLATIFGLYALINFSKQSAELATQTEASVQRLIDIYGEASQVVGDFIDQNARAIGMSKSAGASIAATYGNLLSVWADQETNAQLTNNLLNQTAVVASKTGRTTTDVAERIRSGLLGNTEAIEDLGINVNIKTIEITDAFKRIADGRSWEQLNAYEQSQVRTLAILEQSTNKYGTTVAQTSATVRNQYQAAYEDFKNTWGQVVNTVLIPVLKVLTQVFTIATKGLQIIAGLTGKTIDTSNMFSSQETSIGGAVENQEALTDAVKGTNKELKKSLAGFDEINILSQDTAESGGAGATGAGSSGGVGGIGDLGLDYDNSFVDKISGDMAAIMAIIGGALAGVGLLLIFFGHIGWGIGFLIAGASIFAVSMATLSSGDQVTPISEKLMKILAIAGTALAALGLILLFSGVWKWGIAFLVAGAAALGVAIVATKSGKVDKEAEKMLINIMTIAGAALLALGVILLCFGVVSPLSIGLVVAGAASLAGAIALNPQLVFESVSKFLTDNAGLIVGISLALLVLGVVLCVCGVVTPLSIGLIVVGATGLVTEIVLNWDLIKTSVSNFLRDNAGLIVGVSLALLVLGIILCCTGVALPLGIGLIVVGAAGLAAEVALNWDTIKEKTKTAFNQVINWVKTWGLLVLGIILTISGVSMPLGIALMIAGGANLAEAQDPLWTAIVDKVKEVWETIKTFWNTHIAKYFTAEWWGNLGKKMINGLIKKVVEGLNKLIEKINSFGFDLPDVLGGGYVGFNISKITPPQLAQGTVVPPNRKFLAMLGDNTKEHEIVSPVSTMKQAFTEAMIEMGGNFGGGNTEVVLEIDGREFGRAVVEQGNRENRRIGTRLVIA